MLDRRLQTLQRFLIDILGSATSIADDFGSLDADQWCGIPSLAQPSSNLVIDQLSVGEDLEVAIRMLIEYVEQMRVHERLATEDPKVAIAMLFGVIDDSVEILFADHLSRRGHVNPTTLAAQLARIDD